MSEENSEYHMHDEDAPGSDNVGQAAKEVDELGHLSNPNLS